MTGDMPNITTATHSHTAYGLGAAGGFVDTTTAASPFTTSNLIGGHRGFGPTIDGAIANMANQQQHIIQSQKETTMANTPTRRLVQVFIADPDVNVPLDQSMLYSGDQKLTDATDQELYFEIDMKSILDKHNAARVKILNKKVKEREEFLEPVKIRDLKMVVVNVAQF